jgi:regulation of enolase protein 1 (concanavalin A-like superfamily)
MGFSNSQTVFSNGSFTGAFNLADNETATDALLVTATSDNPSLLPSGSVTIAGTGASRSLRITPAADAAGTANVTLTVTDGGGNTRSVQFTKLTVRPFAPTVPRVTALAPDRAELTWTDNSSNESGFKIDQSVSSDFRTFQTFTAPAGSTRYVATGLKSNTRYYFRVRSTAPAAGAGGTVDSASSSVASAETPVPAGYPTTPLRATATPGNVTGTLATLSAMGDSPDGESTLTYTWQVVSAPGGVTGSKTPVFGANGTNAAKSTTVRFFAPGAYTLCVSATDASGRSTPSHVDVTVTSTLSRIDVTPKTANVKTDGKLHFLALGRDQFGADLGVVNVTWATTAGKIDAGGQFTAPSTASSVMVTATAAGGSVEGTAQVAVGGVVNPPPKVVQAAAATPNPVTGTTTTLSVAAEDDGGASKLRYTWAATTVPAGVAAPVFSSNGTADAATTVATFSGSGLYSLRVTISDGSLSVTSAVSVDVRPSPTALTVSPAPVTLPPGAKARFTGTVNDQFGAAMASQPPIQWSVEGDGSVDASGVYTASPVLGSARVVASAPLYGLSGSADVAINEDGTAVAPLVGEDVGPVGVPGNDSYSADGTFTVSASGSDIFTAPDTFRFLHRTMTGDVTLIARVASLQNTDPWAKAGLMIRESAAPDARFAYAVVTPGNGVSFGRRTSTGALGGSNTVAGPKAPTWVKLTRNGTGFTAFSSADGQNWTFVGARTINMASTVEVGLCLTSHDDAHLATAMFDNVSVTPVVDLALGKPVIGSSAAVGLEVKNVVDGTSGSRWESLPGVAPGAEAWVRVDLGKTQAIGRVRLNWASAFASGYRVQVSDDDATWTDIYATTTGDGNVDELLNLSVSARYVRAIADTPSAAAGPIAINDFNVYT